MADPAPSSGLSRRLFLGTLGAAGLAGAGLLWRHRPKRWRSGFTIHLLPLQEASGSPHKLIGLQRILQIHLASLGPGFVVSLSNPETELPQKKRAFRLQIKPSRHGDDLRLDYRWQRAGGPWNEVQGHPLPPNQAVAAFLASLPEPAPLDEHGLLLPQDPALAWELIELAQIQMSFSMVPGMRERIEAVVAEAPGSALAWCIFGHLAYLEIQNRRNWSAEDRALAESCMKRAIQLLPGMPFAAGELSQMLSDFGENQASLTVLAKALRLHPHSEILLRRLAYSARNAGLMEVAHRAAQKREVRMGRPQGIENTWLYLGDYQRFEQAIQREGESEGWIPAHRFYMAYSALAQGDRERALSFLRMAPVVRQGHRFRELEYLLLNLLEGNTAESMEVMERLVQNHLSNRTPDGEFILKLAELMALHGKDHRALDLAVRAASHGFWCVEWYERSPFLGPVRHFLRYQALLHTLRERQAPVLRDFPPSAFGL